MHLPSVVVSLQKISNSNTTSNENMQRKYFIFVFGTNEEEEKYGICEFVSVRNESKRLNKKCKDSRFWLPHQTRYTYMKTSDNLQSM